MSQLCLGAPSLIAQSVERQAFNLVVQSSSLCQGAHEFFLRWTSARRSQASTSQPRKFDRKLSPSRKTHLPNIRTPSASMASSWTLQADAGSGGGSISWSTAGVAVDTLIAIAAAMEPLALLAPRGTPRAGLPPFAGPSARAAPGAVALNPAHSPPQCTSPSVFA